MGDLSWRFNDKEYAYIKEVLDSGFASSTSGNMNTRLEEAFAKRFNQNFAITFNSGTTTLHASLEAFGIGYGDGISRMLSNKGFVYYKKHKFRILGRVSMDTITIDISKSNKLLKIGQYVEIINYSHGIDELAKQCKTISNEILTSISNRVPRIYK